MPYGLAPEYASARAESEDFNFNELLPEDEPEDALATNLAASAVVSLSDRAAPVAPMEADAVKSDVGVQADVDEPGPSAPAARSGRQSVGIPATVSTPGTAGRKRKAANDAPAPASTRRARAVAAASTADIATDAGVKKSLPGRRKKNATEAAKGSKSVKLNGNAKEDSSDEEDDGDDDIPDEEWEVEAIRDEGVDDDTKEHLFFVKWKGYPEEDNTWEPKKNLTHCIAMIQAFGQTSKPAKKTRRVANATRKPTARATTKTAAKPGRKPGRKLGRGRPRKTKA